MAHWLLIERLENRIVDENEGFRQFGIPARREGMASQIRTGDYLIFYVSSGVSAFSDVRIATANGVQRLPHGGDYDTAYPVALSTRPEIILPQENWVPIGPLLTRLEFAAGKDWRQLMRASIRSLSEADGKLLVEEVSRRSVGKS